MWFAALKILHNSSPNPPKTVPKASPNPHSKKDASKTRPKIHVLGVLGDFFQFLEGPGPPQIKPKSQKSEKQRLKVEAKKAHVFQHNLFSIFRRFGLRKRSQNQLFVVAFSKTSIL